MDEDALDICSFEYGPAIP